MSLFDRFRAPAAPDFTMRDYRAHLDDMRRPENARGFSSADDAALVSAIVTGGVGLAAHVVKRPREDCVARWDDLLPPHLRNLDRQTELLKIARAWRAGAHDGGCHAGQ